MQLSNSLSGAARCSHCSRSPQLQVRAQAPLSGNTAGPSSNSKATAYVPSLSISRPAGGGSRSYDLPRSSDLLLFTSRSSTSRPSGGASRGAVFATGSGSEGTPGSIERPGGRGGRGDMPTGWDAPSTPQDPALARPGGRGGRDAGLSGGAGSSGNIGSIERPGGRGGRDAALSSIDQAPSTPSIDRPGGRGGREGPSGGDIGGSDGSGSGGSGGSGSGGDSGSSGGSSAGGEGGSNAGKGVGGVALYAGVIAAAWFGHKMLYPEKQVVEEVVKPCCAGKGKKK